MLLQGSPHFGVFITAFNTLRVTGCFLRSSQGQGLKVRASEVSDGLSVGVSQGLAQQRKDLEERTCALLSENEDLRSDVDSLRGLGWPDAHTHIPDVSRTSS